ncbi:MAG: TonB-dependent receptor [Gammaproteobacteria bacterium]|nr:TonB-dependent receptor [Gammaproteobacteria bacterium]
MQAKMIRAWLGGVSHAAIPATLCAALAIVLALHAPVAGAQAAEEAAALEQIVVTARKREESLLSVPISISSVSEDAMERNALRSIADIAPTVPGLNINSDSVGRAFVSIRGIGTALQAGVQPGVGVFQDGIYVRETSYINNPTLDVQRIEVLRGPQGTLYGKNTLGGAINIITREPGDTFEGKVFGSWSDGNQTSEVGVRASGPLGGENLRGKLALAKRESDGFYENRLIGGAVDAADSEQASASLVCDVSQDLKLTLNGYYLDFDGGSTNYSHVTGVTDYRDNVRMNVIGRQAFVYKGGNARLEFPIGSTTVTAIGAYDSRQLRGVSDGDFLALDIVRSAARAEDESLTGELRFDTQFSDTFSTLIGLFASHETSDAATLQTVVPLARTTTSTAERTADTYSLFGTALWRFAADWELSAGVRIDEEDRRQDSRNEVSTAPGVILPTRAGRSIPPRSNRA